MASLGPEKRLLLSLPWHSALGRSNPTRGVETSLQYLGLPGQQGLWAEHWSGSQETMFQSLAESYCMTLACHFSGTLTFLTFQMALVLPSPSFVRLE